jgi:hypothetical protein
VPEASSFCTNWISVITTEVAKISPFFSLAEDTQAVGVKSDEMRLMGKSIGW